MANLSPQTSVVDGNSLYIYGLNISNNATTPATILNVSAGQCRDSTNVNYIDLPATVYNPTTGLYVANPITVNTALRGAGGLDAGTIANDTSYAVYAIGSSTNQVGNGQPLSAYPGSAMISTNFTTPVLPYGYDMFRRIGAIRFGTATILAFKQTGAGAERTVMYNASIATSITAGASAAFAACSVANGIPVANIMGIFKCHFTPTAADDELALRNGDSAVDEGQAVASGAVAGVITAAMLQCQVGADRTTGIDYKVTGTAVAINVQGYVDQL